MAAGWLVGLGPSTLGAVVGCFMAAALFLLAFHLQDAAHVNLAKSFLCGWLGVACTQIRGLNRCVNGIREKKNPPHFISAAPSFLSMALLFLD